MVEALDQFEKLKTASASEKDIHELQKAAEYAVKTILASLDVAEKELQAKEHACWDYRQMNRWKKELSDERELYIKYLRHLQYLHRQEKWLIEKFADGEYRDVEGLCKIVDREEIEQNDWSLTPGRYVGVAPQEEEDEEDFAQRMEEIHIELAGLHEKASQLMQKIQENFKGLR